jgi:hypothetical protein
MHLKGARANEESHRVLFTSVLKGSKLLYEDDIGIRFLAPSVAIMHATGSVRLAFQKTLPAGWRLRLLMAALRTKGAIGNLFH